MGAYKITCLSLIEKEYKAKMTPCGAWHLAKNFPGGATAEERHTRTYCSVFNRCHTSRMRVVGKGVVEEISRLISDGTEYPADSAVCCKSGNTWYTMLVMAEDDVLLLAESSEKIQELLSQLPNKPETTDLSDVLAQLQVAGAKLDDVLADFDLTAENMPESGKLVKLPVAEVNTIVFSDPDFPLPSVTLIFNAAYAEGMWEEFVDTYPVKPAGYAAYDAIVNKPETE